VNHQKHRITRICTPDVDPLTEPADGLERRLTDAGAKRCRRYSDSNSQDELRGANGERTAIQATPGFVSGLYRALMRNRSPGGASLQSNGSSHPRRTAIGASAGAAKPGGYTTGYRSGPSSAKIEIQHAI